MRKQATISLHQIPASRLWYERGALGWCLRDPAGLIYLEAGTGSFTSLSAARAAHLLEQQQSGRCVVSIHGVTQCAPLPLMKAK